ncbi:nicotianamine synthase family protein [Fuchsiella alkaliacetigena]|uniref:nicotianamine synthase family protein n=1 Tax=Fuchsiella alkaliacetigena TaxID=957042 RepID=UPI00200A3EBD|nr:nicotianamine synthase family protein [Fuchsiella alkaliacetigena]MCK8825984.1 hypothetical protein [Fuchsiella alkaliacetigena]
MLANNIFSKSVVKLIKGALKVVKSFEFLGSKWRFFGQVYQRLFYKSLVEKEIKAAGLKEGMKILHIGSGPLPMTAISLAEQGYQVQGVDNDSQAITVASNLVKELELDDKVSFNRTEGVEVDTSVFDAIWLSLHVHPKDKVLKEIIVDLKAGQRIVYRNPRGILSLAYPRLEPETLTNLPHQRIKQTFGKESVVITN